MWLPAAFQRLQWKLTITYTLVTGLWIVALEVTLITTLGLTFFRSGYLPGRLADSLVTESAAIQSAVIRTPPNRTEIAQWIDKLVQRGEWLVDEDLLNYYADTSQPDEFHHDTARWFYTGHQFRYFGICRAAGDVPN